MRSQPVSLPTRDAMRERRPLRTLSLLLTGALGLLAMVLGPVMRGDAAKQAWVSRPLAPADTDSVAVTSVSADTDSVAIAAPVRPVPADTDSVAIASDTLRALLTDSLGTDSLRVLLDSLGADSLRAVLDSLAVPDTSWRVERYLSRRRSYDWTASLFPRQQRPLGARMSSVWRHELTVDSTGQYYIARETVGAEDVRYPLRLDRRQYRRQRMDQSLAKNWEQLIRQRAQQRQQQRRGGLGLNITVPGGRQSAFTTIFGKNEVDLRVNGQADIRAGFDYRKSEQQVNLGSGAQVDPDFKQDLRLGVTGTIGDKMRVDVNWDTNRDFDYQNQLKLQYTGYEDEIIQSVEAGNVFLQTPSTLIRGGQSLFGIKSEFKMGGARLTTVVSQQEGQSNNLSIEGGAESTQFDLKPTDYEERIHYFLSYYFRNRWEDALSAPPNILVDGQFERITDIEVWKLQPVAPEEQNVRQVVAMVDLGESPSLVTEASGFTRAELPGSNIDQYSDEELANALRPGELTPKDFLESAALMDQPLTDSDYQVGQFKKLERGRDYEIDEILGYISLKQRLQDSEALAVSFRYIANGRTVQVGDFSSQTGGGDNSQTSDRIALKLIKPINLKQPGSLGTEDAFNPAAWYLEMRNIYRLGRGLRSTEFELEVTYEPPGKSASTTLPGVTGQQTLIQALGLDRVNENGAPRPDNLFDYLPNYSILPGEGLLIFPYLEPFGDHINDLVEASINDPAQQQEARTQFVFSDLYTLKKENARRNTQLDVYRIEGSFKGAIQSFYTLPGAAFAGLVEGSVRVSSGGTPLQEGSDYVVDYQGGTLTITNPSYLTAGRDIEISYEQNALINLQKKTLLGARLDYNRSDRLLLGATVMRMSQKSLTDKFRIGEEPIANTIWGVDGNLNLEPRWLTRAVDALPLIQTKEPSQLTITGEFAQLLPGHTQTNAFEDAQRELSSNGRNFKPDELEGVSFVDDFEGFENTFSLNRPGTWRLSAPPIDSTTLDEASLSATKRSVMGWYQLNPNSIKELAASGAIVRGDEGAVNLVTPRDVFPNRQTTSQERFLSTLDVYFTPHQRGPYNYNLDLGGFLDAPTEAWGGMTQRLSEGYTDFTLRNIEFVEFIFQPFPEGDEVNPDARLYVDLGQISEDVIPDAKLNTEDGLSLSDPGNTFTDLARLSTSQQDQVINPISGERVTEDLGLDGLASFRDNVFAGTQADENVKFADFVASLDNTTSARFPDQLAREIAKARRDPSGDDYHYFLDNFFQDNQLYPNGTSTIQERFSHFFPGQELNSFEAQTKLSDSSNPRGNSRVPDTEDLNLNSTLDTEDSYFQYELPLNRTLLDELARPDNVDDYVVEEIRDGNGTGTGWYLVRIPVKNFTRRVGDIQDFTLIESIRFWTSGHTAPLTMRFATMELVGSQWRKSPTVTNEAIPGEAPLPPPTDDDVPALDDARLSIESVNNEENAIYAIPQGTIVSEVRTSTGERRQGREQSMAIRVENLRPGRQQAIFQTYNQGHDLLKYKHLRMFVHLHGMADGRELQEPDRDKVRMFVRIGANESNDYYEYEQPLTPSPLAQAPEGNATSVAKADYLWRTNQTVDGESGVDLNGMNIVLGALNQLKFERDDATFPTDTVFWSDNGISNLQDEVGGADGFAPPGTRIGVKGTPSLSNVNTIVIGIRNPASEGGTVIDDATIWVNELRVSGYDESSGFSALVNADMKLADLGRLKATFQTQTDGFGGLASTLGEREQVNLQDWTINTQFNVDKFIPERFGWSIPVTFEVKSSTSTPRYDPNRGDVRVEDLLSAIDANENLSDAERQARKDAIVEQAQTFDFTRSFSSRLQKSGSRSPVLRNTLDGISFSYSFAESDGRTPNLDLRNSWRWNSTLSYRLNVRRPRFFRPFGFLGDLPVIGVLGGLRFNYLPNSLSLSAGAARRYSESKERPDPLRTALPDALDQDDLTADEELLVNEALFPLRPQHTFTHDRGFGLQYNPFGFLNLSFDTNTNQTLNDLGVIIDSSTVVIDADGNPVRDNRAPSVVLDEDSTLVPGLTAFGIEQLQVRPIGNVVNDVFGGESPRTDRYSSRINATFRPRTDKVSALDWITVQDVGYSANFSWRNGSVGNNFGATAGTSVDLRGGLTVRPVDLFEKFGFYRKIQEDQQEAEREKRQRRQEREAERARRRQEQEQAQERQRLEEAREPGDAEPPPDEEQPREEEPAPEEEQAPEEGQQQPETEQPPAPEGQEPPAEEEEEQGDGGFKLPLPNPVGLLRQTFLAVTGVEDVRLSYNGNRSNESTNIGTEDENGEVSVSYSLLNALKGEGPSLGYRLGLTDAIDLNQRIINDRIQAQDARSTSDRFQASTRLRLTQNLNVNLNWNVEWSTQQSETFRSLDSTSTTETGTNRASVWAFQASYLDLFTSQLDAFRRAQQSIDSTGTITTNDVLTNQAITRDFISAYLNGLGSLDENGRLPIPMPGWQVNYNGIASWPLIRSLTQNATLRHGYSADYGSDYRTNLVADPTASITLQEGPTIVYDVPDEEVNSVRVNERFQPLIALDLSFKGNIQTSIGWNKGNSYTLSTTNNSVSETKTNELTFSASYQTQGIRLPFLSRRLNNRVGFNLTVSRSTNDDRTFLVRNALEEAASRGPEDPAFEAQEALEGDFVQILTQHARLTVAPKITYQISNRVSADAFVRYERFEGDSRRPSTTTLNGGFNFRVSIAN